MGKKRIFLACQIADPAKNEIEGICQKLKGLGFALRLTPKENLHITLAFLEKVEPEKLIKISVITKSICATFPQFSLYLSGLGAFPNLKLPKVVFLNLTGEISTITNLTKKIRKGLEILGFKFEEEFVPHITIARTKSYVNKLERVKLGETIQRWGKFTPIKVPIDSVVVFESKPTSAGHKHTLLKKINLGK